MQEHPVYYLMIMYMVSSFCYCFRALSCPRELDGARLQMRLSFSPTANIFMCLVQLFDCYIAGALGLLRVLVYLVYPHLSFTFLDDNVTGLLTCQYSFLNSSPCILSVENLLWHGIRICFRHMQMEEQQCSHMKEKQASGSFIVSGNLK